MEATPSGPTTRPSLLVRIRNRQDQEAWNLFVKVYGPLVFGWCQRAGLNEEDALDVTQNVYVKLNKVMARFRYEPQRGKFRSWLGKVTQNACWRFKKKEQRLAHGQGGDESLNVVGAIPARQVDPIWDYDYRTHLGRVILDRVRSRLSDQAWRIFELRCLKNRSVAEVVRDLELSRENVYCHTNRALKVFKEVAAELAADIPDLNPPDQT
jgi:RNA polymerase sigma-70 factor, ECF subfamily